MAVLSRPTLLLATPSGKTPAVVTDPLSALTAATTSSSPLKDTTGKHSAVFRVVFWASEGNVFIGSESSQSSKIKVNIMNGLLGYESCILYMLPSFKRHANRAMTSGVQA
jgi:hypothetical protein